MAYDIDENNGERAVINLVDETEGTTTAVRSLIGSGNYLTGTDNQWHNTTFFIAPQLFEAGHTYHFEVLETVEGWKCYIRSADVRINVGEQSEDPVFEQHDVNASISQDGELTISLNLKPKDGLDATYGVEYTVNRDYQMLAGYNISVRVSAVGSGFTNVFDFASDSEQKLERGDYDIFVIISNEDKDIIATYATTATYDYRVVEYNDNGRTVPVDTNKYNSGDSATILYNPVSTRTNYVFLGWSTDKQATEPMYEVGQDIKALIGDEDLILYAVWQKISSGTIDKLMPATSSKIMIERRDSNGNAVVETNNPDSTELPYGVTALIAADDTDYGDYVTYAEDSPEYDSWFIYGIDQYTTPDELKAQLSTGSGDCVISNCQGSYVGTGTIVKVFDENGNFVEQFRVVIYGDLDNSGSVTSSDTNIAIQESKKPSWSKASDERVPYMFRAANVDQSLSFSSSDANLLIMCNKNKAEIDQTAGLVKTSS
jgi:uncharacterized repeat protein (TIGR02543 family)